MTLYLDVACLVAQIKPVWMSALILQLVFIAKNKKD